MKSSFQIGRIFGISIRIDYTWFVVFALVVWSFGGNYFPERHSNWSTQYPKLSPALYWLMGVVTALLFFGSVLAHELAHSLVSRARGVPVPSITLFILGGVARLSDEPRSPSSEFWMALAGPATSVGIGLIFGALRLVAGGTDTPPAALAGLIMYMNFVVAVFNLLPGFPLDGGRVFRSIIWGITGDLRKATRIASTAGRTVAYILILFGAGTVVSGNLLGGMWIAFIGWFLQRAASSSYRQLAIREILQGVKVRDVMMRDYPQSPHGLTIAAHPDDELYTAMRQMSEEGVDQLPVVEDGQFIGVIARENLIDFISAQAKPEV